jgi:hypothetical protein
MSSHKDPHTQRADEEFEGIGKLYEARFGRLRPGKDDRIRDSMDEDNMRQFSHWIKREALTDAIFRIIEVERQLQIAEGAQAPTTPWPGSAPWKVTVETSVPFPYPIDQDGWICSVCHGWNIPKDRVCMHSHLPKHLQPVQETGGEALRSGDKA